MNRLLQALFIQISLLFFAQDLYAQNYDTPIYNIAAEDFNNLKTVFLEYGTNSEANKLIYDKLDELQQAIGQVHTNQQDRYLLNSLVADIKAFKSLLSGLIGGRVPDHLADNDISRIKNIFGQDCVFTVLKVRIPDEDSKEIEFVELTLSNLRVTYFHNKSKTAMSGVRIKCYGAYKGHSFSGDFGAFNGEFNPINNNVDGNYYIRVSSASITKRF